MSSVLVTPGGPHPPEKWAVVTAAHIMPFADDMPADRLLLAQKLRAEIAIALAPHHDAVQKGERRNLAQNGAKHFGAPLEPGAPLNAALAAIQKAAKGTPWEAHFAQPAVQSAIRQEVGNHFATAMDIERQWHARRHPHLAESKAYLAARGHLDLGEA